MAIVSILHRISGLLIAVLFPVMLCYLHASLESSASFDALQRHFGCPWTKLIIWVFSSAWAYHVIAGARHLLLDMGIGESLIAGRRSAVIVIVLAVVSTLLLGVWIW